MPTRARRTALTLVAGLVIALFGLAMPAWAQGNRTDCGNGFHCPAGNACLINGACGELIEVVPGSTQTSTGNWCEPGFRESKVQTGKCLPESYTECASGLTCPSGMQCAPTGGCIGGPPPTGPTCGGVRCAAGRICSTQGTCLNPQYFQDCGNGTICTKSSACHFPRGCALVAPQRTRQQPN